MSQICHLVTCHVLSHHHRKTQGAVDWLTTHKLDNTFRYTAVHKRKMEGGCDKLYKSECIKDARCTSKSVDPPTTCSLYHNDTA